MPPAKRQITPSDLIPDGEYARQRRERRAALLPIKRLRRVSLGPVCTILFESFDTMLFQVQEMLLTEKGGAAQVPDELAAYNPLIPQGSELVATIMFEIDDPVRRAEILARLGGVEDCFFIAIGTEAALGVSEELHLHVACPLDIALQVDGPVAKGRFCLAGCRCHGEPPP